MGAARPLRRTLAFTVSVQRFQLPRSFPALIADLSSALARPLPAAAAHALMAPVPRRAWPEGGARVRHAAGLLFLFPRAGHAHIVLTVRAETLGRHSGQVSLPGGVIEPGEAFEQAALREAHEEISLPSADIEILGALSPIDIPVSGFRLHPVVGASDRAPVLTPADGEVARILEIPVEDLLAPGAVVTTERERDGSRVAVPAFRVGRDEIWGATAMVLAEFLVVLGWKGPSAILLTR
jgi:8-oxo-dGTP pyrophosphatase MutT (NUDIX family)